MTTKKKDFEGTKMYAIFYSGMLCAEAKTDGKPVPTFFLDKASAIKAALGFNWEGGKKHEVVEVAIVRRRKVS